MGLIIFEDGITKGNAETFNYNFNEILNMVCPIGKVEVFFDDKDHSNYLGFTWERTALERSPVGYNPDSTNNNYKTIGNTFGSKDMQKHSHVIYSTPRNGTQVWTSGVQRYTYDSAPTTQDGTYLSSVVEAGTGTSGNIPPVEVMAFWKRIS